MTTKVVHVIFSDEDLKGDGTAENIYRRIPKLFTLDGELICSYDMGPGFVEGSSASFVDRTVLSSLEGGS